MNSARADGLIQTLLNLPPTWSGLSNTCRFGRLESYDGTTLTATGFDFPVGAGASVTRADGTELLLEVVGFQSDTTQLAPLGAVGPVRMGQPVIPRPSLHDVAVGDALLGRVLCGLGHPIDRRGRLPFVRTTRPLMGTPNAGLDRGRVTGIAPTGVRAIDALLTMGRGQRVALMAGSGVGKSVLMGQMLAGTKADRIVVALVGERGREVADFLATHLPPDVRARAVVVAVAADQAPILRLRAAARAMALAEAFRDDGHHCMLLIDSLTRVAHAQREIGLALGEPPTARGYPPSALALIPQLVERAGVDPETGGAITAVFTVLADGDDLNDPVVDAARAICDGHIVLSRALAEQGVYPAIDVARSLSRVMSDIVPPDHAAAAARFRALWSAGDQVRDLVLMGAYQQGSDALSDEAIARQGAMRAFVTQPPRESVAFDDARAALLTGFGVVETAS